MERRFEIRKRQILRETEIKPEVSNSMLHLTDRLQIMSLKAATPLNIEADVNINGSVNLNFPENRLS